MACHARGMISKDDQVRRAVEASDSFSAEEKDTVKALYPLREKLDRLLKEDAERFRKAVEKSGDSVQKTDTVVLLATRFEEELDLKLAAAEAGLKPDDLARALRRSARLGRVLAPLRVGGTVKRDTFVEAFRDVVRDLGLGTLLSPSAGVLAKALTNSIGMKLVLIPAGTFKMGAPPDEKERYADEQQHEVRITRDFHLGVFEVTQKQFRAVMGKNPSHFSRDGRGKEEVKGLNTDDFPVENVSWDEAVGFCEKLSALAKEKDAGRSYRLPTEAEWEYACRGGEPTSAFHLGNSLSSGDANFDGNQPSGEAERGEYLERTCKVGSYKPNAFGLFDMHGNVSEWCADWYARDYYRKSPKVDPGGPADGTLRVTRGGGWSSTGRDCRSAFRRGNNPGDRAIGVGFRVALVVK
jgi:formylglycine-generating enzyme required for sulfatase activity